MNWETGRYQPPIRSMPAILGFLGYDPFPAPTTLGARLLETRRRNGWSTSTAARHLGVDRATWENWEHGGLVLFRKHRTRIAEFLGVDERSFVDEMRAVWNGKHRRWDRELGGTSQTRRAHLDGVNRAVHPLISVRFRV